MKKYLLVTIGGLGLAAAISLLLGISTKSHCRSGQTLYRTV